MYHGHMSVVFKNPGVPNREIMARLYISEGTFNRTRRNAIRGLARLLMEKYPVQG